MSHANHEESVELLQQLGLKEYEARCFVALSRVPEATAREISELSEVPRTRVYDAVRELEEKGLVEIRHDNPQAFRALSVTEAAGTLERQYQTRIETLADLLSSVPPARDVAEDDPVHEVWSISGADAIESRTGSLVGSADAEVFLVLGTDAAVSPSLVAALADATDRRVSVVVGAFEASLRERIADAVPAAETFVSGLEWLSNGRNRESVVVDRLLLVDGERLLVETRDDRHDPPVERAVYGRGFSNGVVTIARRLLATGRPDRGDE